MSKIEAVGDWGKAALATHAFSFAFLSPMTER
jgi:hypothetical protein